MSSYPDPNYAPPPTYPSTEGESCADPKPNWFYGGGTFCDDVTIDANLSVAGLTATNRLIVAGREFRPTRIITTDGVFTVLASR
jgi:hypothetical protein